MAGIRRRDMLGTLAAATAATAAAALGGLPAAAAFTPPARGRSYQRYGGHNFIPISTFKNGARTDWTYNDNGSVYVAGTPTLFGTRLQLPNGAVIEEVLFNYFLGNPPPMIFSLIAFDNANGYQTPIPTIEVNNVDSTRIQTAGLTGLPVRVDNGNWNYVLRWFPGAADPDHMLWGARVGYRGPAEDE